MHTLLVALGFASGGKAQPIDQSPTVIDPLFVTQGFDMSIDAQQYQASHVAFSQPLASLFFRTESAARMVTQRGGRPTPHHQAAERVIHTIHERLYEPLMLQDMAEIAQLSPYHFNRVFRQVTGIPPSKFQAALRLQAAKRLLMTTQLSVTEICFMVGYNSLGTFTKSFTELVGLSPSQLRSWSKDSAYGSIQSIATAAAWHDREAKRQDGWTVQGTVSTQECISGPILIGLFSSPIPESQPVACTLVTEVGGYQIHNVPGGEHYMLVAAFDQEGTSAADLMQDQPILVGKARHTIATKTTRAAIKADVLLRPAQSIDPPILVALSQLLHKRLKELHNFAEHDGLFRECTMGRT
ncbi:MAG TPA: helix-turn-helix domain-containing protein [Herpetosiphonaceae bacterium]